MFFLVESFIPIIFIIVIGTIIFQAVRGIITWNSNNQSPIRSVEARVTSKRADIKRHNNVHHGPGGIHHNHPSTSTTYYVTFQFDSNQRLEFRISGKEYGQLAEGDSGKLSYQSSRYLDFERR